jgi:hypothetical protein
MENTNKRREFLSFLTIPALAAFLSSSSSASTSSCTDITQTLELLKDLETRAKKDLSNVTVLNLKWGNNGEISFDSSTKTWTFTGGGDTTLKADLLKGTSLTAFYADLAERYHADSDSYIPGDVLGHGGVNEVTLFKRGMSLAGVVSSNPALKLNDSPDNKKPNMPFIALKGRVPVSLSNTASKGDFIFALDNGKAIAVEYSRFDDFLHFNLIGVALSDSSNGLVEVKI